MLDYDSALQVTLEPFHFSVSRVLIGLRLPFWLFAANSLLFSSTFKKRVQNMLPYLRCYRINAVPALQFIYHYHNGAKSTVSCIFDLQYNMVPNIGISCRVKSNSHKVNLLLILWFSVYRCHGNIDFPKNHIVPNFNLLSPVTGVNFISIPVWVVC